MEVRAPAARSGTDLSAESRAPAPVRNTLFAATRAALAGAVLQRGLWLRERSPTSADRWLRLGSALAVHFGDAHRALVALRRSRGDRAGALAAAQAATTRFPDSADAWIMLAETWLFVFRPDAALAAHERAIALEERPDALEQAGALYLREGRFRDAAARFARAYAAGGGPAALLANARALAAAGDGDAAEQALALWATLVPDGADRLATERARLPAPAAAAPKGPAARR